MLFNRTLRVVHQRLAPRTVVRVQFAALAMAVRRTIARYGVAVVIAAPPPPLQMTVRAQVVVPLDQAVRRHVARSALECQTFARVQLVPLAIVEMQRELRARVRRHLAARDAVHSVLFVEKPEHVCSDVSQRRSVRDFQSESLKFDHFRLNCIVSHDFATSD